MALSACACGSQAAVDRLWLLLRQFPCLKPANYAQGAFFICRKKSASVFAPHAQNRHFRRVIERSRVRWQGSPRQR